MLRQITAQKQPDTTPAPSICCLRGHTISADASEHGLHGSKTGCPCPPARTRMFFKSMTGKGHWVHPSPSAGCSGPLHQCNVLCPVLIPHTGCTRLNNSQENSKLDGTCVIAAKSCHVKGSLSCQAKFLSILCQLVVVHMCLDISKFISSCSKKK